MYAFHSKIEYIEKEDISVMEVGNIIGSVEKMLMDRVSNKFIPLKVKVIITKNYEHPGSQAITNEIIEVYKRCLVYLKLWTSSFQEYKIFEWICLENIPVWTDIEKTIEYLSAKGVEVNDSLLFDQIVNLTKFLKEEEGKDDFLNKQCGDKWVKYFNSRNHSMCSEILKICSYCFAIPAHNANTERIFSLMKSQWTDERNRLLPESVKNILLVLFNFKDLTCGQFYDHYRED